MPTLPKLDSRVRINEDVLFQELNGEGVLLNLKSGVYFGLDQVGTRVWQLLEKHTVLSEILEAVVAEYDVPQERCARDLVALIADLERHDLVTLS